jgi:hypothetical protein
MDISKTSASLRQPISLPGQLFVIVLASIAAIVANVLFYFILKDLVGINFIAPEQFPLPEVSSLPVTDVIIFSAVYCAGAGIVFLIVANTARKPAPMFAAISFVVLVVSCILPLRIPTPPIPMATKLALASMHILGAAVLVPLLITFGFRRGAKEEVR